jgi:hypothetical protein
MKRTLLFILSALIIFSITSCANKADDKLVSEPTQQHTTSSLVKNPKKLSDYQIVDEKHFMAGDNITYEQAEIINGIIQGWLRMSSMQYLTIDHFEYIIPISALKKAGNYYYNIYNYSKGGNLLKHIVLIYRKFKKKEESYKTLSSDLTLEGAFVFVGIEHKENYIGKSYKENQKNTKEIFGKAGKEIADFGASFMGVNINDTVYPHRTLHFTDKGLLLIEYKKNGKQAVSKILKGVFDDVYKSVKHNYLINSGY